MAENGYFGLLTKIFMFLVFMVGAIVSAYFGIVGLFYGQGIVEQDVLGERYKYECVTNCDDPATATYNSSAQLTSYTDYLSATASLNAKIGAFLTATAIAFTLIGLYLLISVVKELRMGVSGGKGKDMY